MERYQGGEWAEQTVPGRGAMRAVAVYGGTALAAGYVVEGAGDWDAGIWKRNGDDSWSLTCADQICGDSAPRAARGRQQILDMTVTDSGTWVAVGRETANGANVPAVWLSQDGTSWARVEGELSGFSAGDFMSAVASGYGTLVAVGSSSRDGAAWTSSDGGATWTKVTDDELSPRGRAVVPTAVSATPVGFVAVGRERLESGGKFGPVAWYSAEGRSWTRAAVEKAEFSGQTMVAVASTPTGLVAAGSDNARGRVGVWQSADGTRWAPVSSSSFAREGAAPGITGLAPLADGTILAVGYATGEGLAWISEPSTP